MSPSVVRRSWATVHVGSRIVDLLGPTWPGELQFASSLAFPRHLPVPSSLQLANRDENKITEWIYHDWKQALLTAIVVISVFELHRHGIAETISTLTAVAVAR